jgi:FG-GAP repeat
VGEDVNCSTSSAAAGIALTISNNGETVVVGAYGENEGVGSARVFGWNRNHQVWEQIGLTLTGKASGDSFGCRVAINGIARRVLVGAPDRDGSAGQNSGEVKVFQFS